MYTKLTIPYIQTENTYIFDSTRNHCKHDSAIFHNIM